MATGLRLGSNLKHSKEKIGAYNLVGVLAYIYGYELSQNNGQRIFGPPMSTNGETVQARPDKCCEIFIGNIPRNAFEDLLIPMFMECGKLYEFRLMMDFQGNNRGFAFALFCEQEFAETAIALYNGFEMQRGRRLAVVSSVDNNRLYVGGIKHRLGRDVVQTISSHVTNLMEIHLGVQLDKECDHCFIHFDTHTNAAMARRCLIESSFRIWGCKVIVDWAHRHEGDITVPTVVTAADIRSMNDGQCAASGGINSDVSK